MVRRFILFLLASAALLIRPAAETPAPKPGGEAIYQNQCVSCHGPKGQGVAGKSDEALYGERSVESLAGLIQRTMPEDDPGTLSDEEADAVAAYIHHAFYSREARARNNPVKVDLARLTNRQYRESLADLIGGFLPVKQAAAPGGLKAQYFQSQGMNKKHRRINEQVDERVDFNFGTNSPMECITEDQFSIAWSGSLLARESGEYSFRIVTPNGARLYLNTDLAAGDGNSRDDSDAKRQPALIDLWVSSGGMVREAEAQLMLLGGRSYPLRVDYFKFKETSGAVRFEWKPPHGVWAVVPPEFLSPEPSSSTLVVSAPLPPDDASQGYERGTAISKAWHDATTKAAVEAATQVEARVDRLAGTDAKQTNRLEKLKAFAVQFAQRAFRRPLEPGWQESLIDPIFASAPTPEIAVKRAVLLALKSPRFLYPDLESSGDSHAVAARLALTLWDSMPDAALREAAERGELASGEQVRAQARRMMEDARAKAKLREFFHHWLAVEEAEDISKDPKAYPDFNEAVLADLRESLEKFVDHVVWGENSDYRDLLLADYLFLNPRLAKFYGAEPPKGEAFEMVRFDPSQRAGIFTHPFLLSAFSYHKSSSPIHRGVFLTRNVMGRFLKPPPMAIEFMDDRFDPSLTMREKVTQLTSKDACMGCHITINPLGFSLEHYDAVGRYRTMDNNKPVDALSDYLTAEGEKIQLRGPRDLAAHAASSPEARKGFVRQMFQQSVKQAPAAYGPDTLDKLDAAFAKSEFHIRHLLVEIAVASSTKARNPQLASHP